MSGGIHGTLLHLETRALATVHGEFAAHVFCNVDSGRSVVAAALGAIDAPEPLLARVHSSCVTSEVYGSCDCDCVEQLDAALAAIAGRGRGIVFYLMQEGRGAGFTAKVRDRMIVQASGERLTTFDAYARMGLARDHRSYEEVEFARRLLGIDAPLTLLTGNPEKVGELTRAGVPVADTAPLPHAASPFNRHYLSAKARSGRAGEGREDDPAPAALPEPVAYFDPFVPAGAPHLVCTASYLLPIVVPAGRGRRCAGRAGADRQGPHWFRLHAYFDLAANRERVVLAYRRRDGVVPLVRVQGERLLERFPLAGGGTEKARWHACVRAFVEHGAGCAVVESAERAGGEAAPDGTGDPTVPWLLARHLPDARARLALAGAHERPAERALGAALAALGVALEPPLALAGPEGSTPGARPGSDAR